MFTFPVGNALVMLLQNADLLPLPSQRLAAVLILHELFKSQDSQNFHPFSSVFALLLVCLCGNFFKQFNHVDLLSP